MSDQAPPPTTTDDGAPTNSQDLTVFVQNLLEQMQSRFSQMSDAIIGRIDEMGNRIDDLEKVRGREFVLGLMEEREGE